MAKTAKDHELVARFMSLFAKLRDMSDDKPSHIEELSRCDDGFSTSTARSTVFAAGAAILCYMAISPAEAHDASRPELDGWYEKLESGKGPCCDGSDSAHVEPSDWETQNKPSSHYKVRLDGVWADVPDEAVVTGPNRDGRTLVWYYNGWNGHSGIPGKVIKCFMPGTMT